MPEVYHFDFSASRSAAPPFVGAVAIYVLVDPRAPDVVRYVGKSYAPHARYQVHCCPSQRRDEGHRSRWLRKLFRDGITPAMRVIAWVAADAWVAAETAAIAQARQQFGKAVTNGTDGGEGIKGRVHSPETRAKMAAAARGRKMPREAVEKHAAAIRGRKRDPAAIARCAAANRGRKHTPETIEKMRAAKQGHPVSQEQRAKQAASLRGRKATPEQIARAVEARRGYTHSPETRARLAEGRRRARQCSQMSDSTQQ